MNRNKRLNRTKRVRIITEKQGCGAKSVVYKNTEKLEEMAADKTPSHLRTGNYYTQVESESSAGVKYLNTVPWHKLRYKASKASNQGFMFNAMQTLKRFFGFGAVKA